MSLKTMYAVKVVDFGFVVDRPKHAAFVERAEDATLYATEEQITDMTQRYDFQPKDYELVPVTVLIVSSVFKGESVKNELLVSFSRGDNFDIVHSQRLSDDLKQAMFSILNLKAILKLLFSCDKETL